MILIKKKGPQIYINDMIFMTSTNSQWEILTRLHRVNVTLIG